MRTLSRAGARQHRVRCRQCGHDRRYDDVRDAVNDYVDHECGTEGEEA